MRPKEDVEITFKPVIKCLYEFLLGLDQWEGARNKTQDLVNLNGTQWKAGRNKTQDLVNLKGTQWKRFTYKFNNYRLDDDLVGQFKSSKGFIKIEVNRGMFFEITAKLLPYDKGNPKDKKYYIEVKVYKSLSNLCKEDFTNTIKNIQAVVANGKHKKKTITTSEENGKRIYRIIKTGKIDVTSKRMIIETLQFGNDFALRTLIDKKDYQLSIKYVRPRVHNFCAQIEYIETTTIESETVIPKDLELTFFEPNEKLSINSISNKFTTLDYVSLSGPLNMISIHRSLSSCKEYLSYLELKRKLNQIFLSIIGQNDCPFFETKEQQQKYFMEILRKMKNDRV